MKKFDELKDIANLLNRGIITQKEFESLKQDILIATMNLTN